MGGAGRRFHHEGAEVPLLLALVVLLGMAAPQTGAGDELGPPVFWPESSTELLRARTPSVDPVTVNCEPDAVVTSVPVSLDPGGCPSGAGMSCRALGVGSGGIGLGPRTWPAGWAPLTTASTPAHELEVRDGTPGDTADGGQAKDTAASDAGDTAIAVP